MMDAAQALEHMRSQDSLGVRTGQIDCFLVGSTGAIECDSPDGKGTVDVSADEFLQRFDRHQFRALTNADFAQ